MKLRQADSPSAPEQLRREIEARALAQAELDRVAGRSVRLEAKLSAELEQAPRRRRLTAATLGAPLVRKLAVALRGLVRHLRINRLDRRDRGRQPPVSAETENPVLAAERRRRIDCERSLLSQKEHLAELEWKHRILGLRPGRLRRRATGAGTPHPPRGRAGRLALRRPFDGSRLVLAGRDHQPAAPDTGAWPSVTAIVHGPWPGVLPAAHRLRTSTRYPGLRMIAVSTGIRGPSFSQTVVNEIRAAPTDLILVCCDISFENSEWLRRLVEAIQTDAELAAVAPTVRSNGAVVDGGWQFDLDRGVPEAVPTLLQPSPGQEVVDAAAIGGSCVLFRASRLKRALLCGDYQGRLWAVDQSVALRESGWKLGVAAVRVNGSPPSERARDLDILRSRWGPRLRRRVRNSLLNGGGDWCARGLRAAAGEGSPAELQAVCEHLGWEFADEADGHQDLILSRLDPGESAGPWTAEWSLPSGHAPNELRSPGGAILLHGATADFEDLDSAAEALRSALAQALERAAVCIQIGASDWEVAPTWGDYHLGAALARALARLGHESLIQVGSETDSQAGQFYDVLLNLRGRLAAATRPGQVNLIWHISHPHEVSAEELDAYDTVLIASRPYAKTLGTRIGAPVREFLQFTEPERFRPDPDRHQAHQLLFVGNWRNVYRRVVWDAVRTGHQLALYGKGWRYLVPDMAVAESVPHEELRRLYSSCEILLSDHWDDMRELGFISNRVFDGLACGAFIISDHSRALVDEFAGAVETYRTADELRDKIAQQLSDPERGRELAQRGREKVLRAHTAEIRAAELIRHVSEAQAAGRRDFTDHLASTPEAAAEHAARG